METDDLSLEVNTRKIKRIFANDLSLAAETGRAGPALYATIVVLRAQARCDVQENEGVNSLIKILAERSPNISIALLSARVLLKKQMRLGSRDAVSGWKHVRDSARPVLQESIMHHAGATAIMGEDSRWTSPCALPDLPSNERVRTKYTLLLEDARRPSEGCMWATAWNLEWHKAFKEPDVRRGIFVGPAGEERPVPTPGAIMYVCPEKCAFLGSLASCVIEQRDDEFFLRVAHPIKFTTTVDLIETYFRQVQDGADQQLYEYNIRWGVGRVAYVGLLALDEWTPMLCLTKVPPGRKIKSRPEPHCADCSGGASGAGSVGEDATAPAGSADGTAPGGSELASEVAWDDEVVAALDRALLGGLEDCDPNEDIAAEREENSEELVTQIEGRLCAQVPKQAIKLRAAEIDRDGEMPWCAGPDELELEACDSSSSF